MKTFTIVVNETEFSIRIDNFDELPASHYLRRTLRKVKRSSASYPPCKTLILR